MIKSVNKQPIIYLFLGVVLLTHVLILTKLIYFPYPELFIYPYLTNHGLKPYSQILDQHFPGMLFLPINFNNLGMNTPDMARVWSIAIIFITHVLLFFISREVLKSRTKALFVNILYLVWQPFFEGWVLWIDSFLPLLLLPAFYTLYQGIKGDLGDKRERWFFCSGLFLGLGIIFKQVLIPLVFFTAIYIFWKERKIRPLVMFLFGLFSPLVLMILYFAGIGVLKDFWYWTVVFNLTTFREFGRGIGPTFAHLTRVLFVFGLAFLLLILKRLKSKEEQIILIFLTGALFGLSTRFDFVHFQPALPFAILATAYALERFSELRSQTWSGRLTIIGMLGYFLISFWWLVIFYKGHLGDRVISFDSDTKSLAIKIRNYTSPQEKIFVFGAEPHLYQMSDTLPAGDIFVFQFPWFFKVAEQRILEGIIKDKPNIVISNRTVKVEDQKIIEFGKDIDKYISQNYEKIDSVGTTEILYRITP